MTITVSNRANTPVDSATVKYWLFARDLGSRDGRVIGKGESKVSLKALGSATVETQEVAITQVSTRNNPSACNRPQPGQKLGAQKSGLDYAGYGVVVLGADGTILAEDFTAGSMRELVASELPVDKNPWRLRR